MDCLSKKIIVTLLAFIIWSTGFGFTHEIMMAKRYQNHQINIPGDPLSPLDFANARKFPKIQRFDMNEECEIYRNDDKVVSETVERSKDQYEYRIWEGGYIPYIIDAKFNVYERAEIAKAFIKLKETTCIQFITRTFHKDYIFIKKRSGICGSYVGKVGSEQIVTLNRGCMSEGNILHELLHVIGLEHEQCRNDRDDYIRVSFYNISKKGKHNFYKIQPPRVNYAGNYDLLSITHYNAFAFGKQEGFQTIFPNDNVKGQQMGQRERLSDLDQLKIKTYYNCSMVNYKSSLQNLTESKPTILGDLHALCSEFARMELCSSSSWIKLNCPISCASESCTNCNEKCEEWAKEGQCIDSLNADYMKHYCSKSCNFC